MSVRLVVLRHGQTAWNAEGRMQGQCDTPLNDTGEAQAQAVAEPLAALGPARIVASDLKRAATTARMVASVAGLPVDHDERLREICYGEWEGRTHSEIGRDVLAENYTSALNRRGVNGETLVEAAERTAAALRDVVGSAADGETVLVVSHGTVVRAATQLLLGIDHTLWEGFRHLENCHWMVLEEHDGVWRLVSYNLHS